MKKLMLYIFFISLINLCRGQIVPDTLWFANKTETLKGYFYKSEKVASNTLIFTQGFMETGDLWKIGNTLSASGINVFMFDFQGCFESTGEHSLINAFNDLDAAVKFLNSEEILKKYHLDKSKFIIGGYSFGGHLSMLYGIHNPEYNRIISISGGDLGIVADLIISNSNLREGYKKFFKSIEKPNGPVKFKYDDPTEELILNKEFFDLRSQAVKLEEKDIFLAGGSDDNVVSLENFTLPVYRALKKRDMKKLVLKIYQDNHSYSKSGEILINDIKSWILAQN